MAGILIIAESDHGHLLPEVGELMTLGRQLRSATGEPLIVAGVGRDLDAWGQEVKESGADAAWLLTDVRLEDPWAEAYTAVFAEFCRDIQPSVVVLGKTVLGTEVAARLAARLDGSAALNITAINAAAGALEVTRAVFGGAAQARFRMLRTPAVLVPHPKTWHPAEPVLDPIPTVMRYELHLPKDAVKSVLGERSATSQGPDIAQARVLVSGGRGLGGPKPFTLLQDIATLLGGQVSASRPPVDAGWISGQRQVGLTGKTVAPDLYLAIGISGAIQHLAGCSNARTIVAVNNDPKAPIFQYARFGVVGDWQEILPAFREALECLAAEHLEARP